MFVAGDVILTRRCVGAVVAQEDIATWHRPTINKWFDSKNIKGTLELDTRATRLLHDVFPKHIADQLQEGRKVSRARHNRQALVDSKMYRIVGTICGAHRMSQGSGVAQAACCQNESNSWHTERCTWRPPPFRIPR